MGTAVGVREVKEVIRRYLGSPEELKRQLDPPSYEGFHQVLDRFEQSIEELNRRKGISLSPILVAATAVRLILDVLVPYMQGRTDEAARIFADYDLIFKAAERIPLADREKLFRAFLVAGAAGATEALQGERGRGILTRLAGTLKLSLDDIGRMLNVSGETVRRWARGTVAMPDDQLAALDLIGQALGRLEAMFLPDRLAHVVRRRAEVFGGERALDWILRGRIKDVADRYEVLLRYQA